MLLAFLRRVWWLAASLAFPFVSAYLINALGLNNFLMFVMIAGFAILAPGIALAYWSAGRASSEFGAPCGAACFFAVCAADIGGVVWLLHRAMSN